jgi:hypothetical protein
MSQSDYIRHKKTAHILNDEDNLGNVLNGQLFTQLKTYELPNTIYDESLTYNQLLPSDKQNIFQMEKNVNNCPSYILCRNTQNRAHRSTGPLRMFLSPRTSGSISQNEYFWNQKLQNKLCLENEFKECDDYFYYRRYWIAKDDATT